MIYGLLVSKRITLGSVSSHTMILFYYSKLRAKLGLKPLEVTSGSSSTLPLYLTL